MNFDISFELGRLLVFTAEVATAIRMNSAYNEAYRSRDPRDIGLDVMWLSESLHCFDRLGRAIQADNRKEVVDACDSLLSYYRMFTDGVPEGARLKGDPKAVFERYSHLCHPQEAIEIFIGIRDKAIEAAEPSF